MSDDRPHMLRTLVESVEVIVHDAEPPSDAEWASWIDHYRAAAHTLRGIVIYSLGGGPNGKQRSDLTGLLQQLERVPPTHIVTSSVVMRGIVTAVCWFLPPTRRVRTFALDDLALALADLSLPPTTRAEITRVIHAHLKTLEQAVATRRAS